MSMLQTIRDRAQGIMAWVLLIVVGVPFILWGIQNYIDVGKEKPAAVVGDRDIFDRDVTRSYEQLVQEMGASQDLDEKLLRKQALEQLISEAVLSQSADAVGLASSDQEVREVIQTLPYFQVNGGFDKDKYKASLASQGMSAMQFAARIRGGIIGQQFQKAVADSGFATPIEVANLMRLKNQERQVAYVKLSPKSSTREMGDAELRAYYESHLDAFKNAEKIAVDYLSLNLKEIAAKTAVTDEEVLKLYEEQKSNYGTPERRKISHILIAADASDVKGAETALSRAKEIRERILKDGDFSTVAKEVSEDPVSAKSGGDLGYLNRDALDPVISDAAEKLTLGEVSVPVRSSFGYHLIKLTELIPASYKPFDAVKAEIREEAQKNKAESEFFARGQKLAELTFEHPDTLEVAASELGLKIQQTPFFTRQQGEGIADNEGFRKTAFSEDVLAGKNSEPVEVSDEVAIVLRVRDHEAASEKSFDEVKTQILSLLAKEEAQAAIDRNAKDMVVAIRQGTPLADLAKSQGLTVSEARLQRSSEGTPFELLKAVFETARPADEKPVPGEVGLSDGSRYVFAVLSVKDGEAVSKDPKEQESAVQYLEKGYGQLEFTTFVDRLRDLTKVEILKTE